MRIVMVQLPEMYLHYCMLFSASEKITQYNSVIFIFRGVDLSYPLIHCFFCSAVSLTTKCAGMPYGNIHKVKWFKL